MDTTQLLQALQYSVGKTQEEVRMAEQFLQQARTANGFIPSLLLITCNKEVDINVRQAAIVNLHSAVKIYWRKKENGFHEDKQTLKDNVLEALIKCADTPKIYKPMMETIRHIAEIDFPDSWPNLLQNIVDKIKTSSDFQEVYGSLLALSAIFQNFQQLFRESVKLEALVEATFEFLEIFAEKLLEDYSLPAATAAHVILKIFWIATKIIMPRYLLQTDKLTKWMLFFKLILEKGVGDLQTPTEDPKVIAQREKSVYWRNKKVCARILSSFITKYRDVKNNRQEHIEFSKIFMSEYAIPFFTTFVDILHTKKDHYLHIKVQFYAMKYIEKSLKDEKMKSLLQEHLEFLLFDILIPGMFLTLKDKEDWDENPVEFIRNEEDLMERPNNLRIVSSDILQKICSPDFRINKVNVGNVVLMKFMEHAAHILSKNTDPRTSQPSNIQLKEAILHIIGVLYSSVMDNKELRGQMEFLLEKFVIPEFINEIGFIRSRSCWLFGMYGGLSFKNSQVIVIATEGLYKCLLDSQLPVKVQASIAMERVLKQKVALEILKPGLGKIFEIYLELIHTIDEGQLVSALEGIIKKFGEDVVPYAVDLIKNFALIFDKNSGNDEEGDDDGNVEEKELTATGCLSAISNILQCKLPKQTIMALDEIMVPLLNFTLTNDKAEDIEGGLSILNSIVYTVDDITEKMWAFYLELNYMLAGKPEAVVNANATNQSEEQKILAKQKIEGWAHSYITQIVPCLQNYIKKGRNVLFSARDPYFNLTYIELLFKSIDKMYHMCENRKSDFNMAVASTLYITIIENYPREIDNLIPYFLDRVIEYLPKSKSDMMRKIFIEIVAISLWYDGKSTLHYLESKGATESVFGTWIQLLPKFKNDSECERIMIGLASIFRVSVSDMPPLVSTSLPGLLKQLTGLTSKVLTLRIQEEDADENENEDDNDIDDGDDDVEDFKFKRIGRNFNENTLNHADADDDQDNGNAEDEEDEQDIKIKEFEWLNNQGEYDSPFEGKCEIAYLKESLELMQQNQTNAYNELVGCLSNEEKTTLQTNFEKAHAQYVESLEQANN